MVGERLRVNVQLIDAETDAHLWADRYDRKLDDAFAIQSDVAQQIVAAVCGVLTSAERRSLTAAPTENAEAYRLYLQGREYVTRPGYLRQNYETGQQLYERALALDPDFALAHVALAWVHGKMYWEGFDPSRGDRSKNRHSRSDSRQWNRSWWPSRTRQLTLQSGQTSVTHVPTFSCQMQAIASRRSGWCNGGGVQEKK